VVWAVGGPVATSAVVPASDAGAGGGDGRSDAPDASGVGPDRIRWQLERDGVELVPNLV
jgi:hypothetical protein